MNIIILTSKQARERLVKNKFVNENKKRYEDEIYRISDSIILTKKGKIIIASPTEKIIILKNLLTMLLFIFVIIYITSLTRIMLINGIKKLQIE